MTGLDTIIRPILPELQRFEQNLSGLLSSEVSPLDGVMSYVAEAKGKRLRPVLVLLSARLFGETTEATMRTALFVEMLHTATLIHDDVVDGSDERRGRDAVHVRWDTPTAVLSGDYLLAKAMLLLAAPDNLPILREMLKTAVAMSEGEMMQRKTESGEDDYIEVITRKTAMLFRACCLGGALSVDRNKKQEARSKEIDLAGDFGLNLGIVFQLRDDLLDNDDPETTRMAKELLPRYLEKTIAALEGLKTVTADLSVDVLESLRTLAMFCAERSH